jgi:putative nucleotidyltransferase with HDIG domain
MPSKVGSVKQAIVLLGWKKIVQIVLTSCAGAMQDKPVPGYELPSGELWRHSIAVSVAAEGLARELRLPGGDEIFTGALLHDLGKLVMGNFVHEQIEQIEAEAAQGIPFEEAEKRVLGMDHTEIGAQILQSWSFPPEIIQAVRWHHQPEGSGADSRLIDIVHAANVLCLMIGIGAGRDGLQHQISPHASQRLGIKTAHVELIASRTLQWVSELCDVFN